MSICLLTRTKFLVTQPWLCRISYAVTYHTCVYMLTYQDKVPDYTTLSLSRFLYILSTGGVFDRPCSGFGNRRHKSWSNLSSGPIPPNLRSLDHLRKHRFSFKFIAKRSTQNVFKEQPKQKLEIQSGVVIPHQYFSLFFLFCRFI